MISRKGVAAIAPPKFSKIEATVKGGIAMIESRVKVITAKLIMDFAYDGRTYVAGQEVILQGDAGLKPWAKQRFELEGVEFCLVPEAEIIGFL